MIDLKKILFLILIGFLLLTGCGTEKTDYLSGKVNVAMEIEDYGTIKIELYPEYAENTVKNFIALANNGFYDGLTFHRIMKDFMIQGGDVKGDGTGSPTLSAINSNIEKHIFNKNAIKIFFSVFIVQNLLLLHSLFFYKHSWHSIRNCTHYFIIYCIR